MTDGRLSPEERDALAAELALGVLDSDAWSEALRLQLQDRDFAVAVSDWEKRLEPLHMGYAPVAPPATLWAGVAARLDPAPVDGGLVRQLRAWRAGAVGAGALAAALAFALVLRGPQPVAPPPMPAPQLAVAQLTGGPEGPVIVASYDPASASLRLRSSGIDAGPLAPELWIIPADGKPRSLGMVPRDGTGRVTVGAENRVFMADGATLAITMEKLDDGPHAAPSSTPIAVGKISAI
jgi:anti-sigma-K factor RskA